MKNPSNNEVFKFCVGMFLAGRIFLARQKVLQFGSVDAARFKW